jgi:hypothetical protein
MSLIKSSALFSSAKVVMMLSDRDAATARRADVARPVSAHHQGEPFRVATGSATSISAIAESN